MNVSAYTIEEIIKELNSNRLEAVFEMMSRTVSKYPEDEELGQCLAYFEKLMKKKEKGISESEERNMLNELTSRLKSLADWRKIQTYAGTTLPFKDYRSLRGKTSKR